MDNQRQQTEKFAVIPVNVAAFLAACHASTVEFATVLAIYSFRSNANPKPFPSQTTITKLTRRDRRRVSQALGALARDGILLHGKRTIETGPHAGLEVNEYDLPALEKLAAEKPEGVTRTKRRRKRDVLRWQKPAAKSNKLGFDNTANEPKPDDDPLSVTTNGQAIPGPHSANTLPDSSSSAAPSPSRSTNSTAVSPDFAREPGAAAVAGLDPSVEEFLRGFPSPGTPEAMKDAYPYLPLTVQSLLDQYGRTNTFKPEEVFAAAVRVQERRLARGDHKALDIDSMTLYTAIELDPSIPAQWTAASDVPAAPDQAESLPAPEVKPAKFGTPSYREPALDDDDGRLLPPPPPPKPPTPEDLDLSTATPVAEILDLTVDPAIVRLLDEHEASLKAKAEQPRDPESERLHQERVARMFARRDAMGGYTSKVNHSPHVQAILRDLDRRLKEEG